MANGLNLENLDVREGRDVLTVLGLTGRAVTLNAFLGKEDPESEASTSEAPYQPNEYGLKSWEAGGKRYFGASHAEDFMALAKFAPGLVNAAPELGSGSAE